MKKALLLILLQMSSLIFSQNPSDIDENFITNTESSFYSGFNGSVNTIALQSDGKILVGGDFINYQNNTVNRIVRLNSDGSIDNTFVSNAGFNLAVLCIVIQLDGKILVGGAFSTYKGINSSKLIRLNTDGSIDTSFNVGTGFNSNVNTIALQTDNKIIVGGAFTTYKGPANNRIIRLNTDGVRDTTFGSVSNFGFDNIVNSIVITSSNKIIVGGKFTSYNGSSTSKILQLTANGYVDAIYPSIFNGGDVNTIFYSSSPQEKIIIGGTFFGYGGISTSKIVRLFVDSGNIDSSFSIGSGFNNDVNSIVMQIDGKILVGGLFTNYNGITANRFIRLNNNGSIDNFFDLNIGFDNNVNAIKTQSDTKILVGGSFSNYKSLLNKRIVRLLGDYIPDPIDNIPPAPTGLSPQNLCEISEHTISELIVNGSNIKWYDSLTSIIPLPLTTVLLNNINYYATQTIDGFESTTRLVVNVILTSSPLPQIPSEYTIYCNGSKVSDLVSNIKDFNVGSDYVLCYSSSTANTPLPSNTLLTNNTTYYLSQSINDYDCESLRTAATINLTTTPQPQANSPQIFTVGQTLANIQVVGENIKWYSSQMDAANFINSLPNNTVLVNGTTYYATQTLYNPVFSGCESTTSLPITVQTSLSASYHIKLKSSIFPNPVNNNFTINIMDSISLIEIFDILGKNVYSEKYSTNTINIEFLQKGIYILKVNTDYGVFNTKIIKE